VAGCHKNTLRRCAKNVRQDARIISSLGTLEAGLLNDLPMRPSGTGRTYRVGNSKIPWSPERCKSHNCGKVRKGHCT